MCVLIIRTQYCKLKGADESTMNVCHIYKTNESVCVCVTIIMMIHDYDYAIDIQVGRYPGR